MPASSSEVSLYFHVPFCTHKCAYCHFYVIPDKEIYKHKYLKFIQIECQKWIPKLKDKTVVSIYFGGGTPSLLGPQAISQIIQLVQNECDLSNDVEITLEANPENVSYDLMQAYANSGINRVSLGIQTLDESLLKLLERHHTGQKAVDAVYQTSKAGIKNITVDLMYDLPNQTLKSWEYTLKVVSNLPIMHLSLYNLTIEPHTVFFKYKDSLLSTMPDQETSAQMLDLAINQMESSGLKQYEISAFARDNCYSKHNVGYWLGRPFLGFGPSAFSFWEGKRFRNIAHLNKYCKKLETGNSPIDFEESLSTEAAKRELLVIGLRIIEGMDVDNFQKQNGEIQPVTWEQIKLLKTEGFLTQTENKLMLTPKGVRFYDHVATELI